jgi:hypothetical protein
MLPKSANVVPQPNAAKPRVAMLCGKGKSLAGEGRSIAGQGSALAEQGNRIAERGMPAAKRGKRLTEKGRTINKETINLTVAGKLFAIAGRSIADKETEQTIKRMYSAAQASPIAEQGTLYTTVIARVFTRSNLTI